MKEDIKNNYIHSSCFETISKDNENYSKLYLYSYSTIYFILFYVILFYSICSL